MNPNDQPASPDASLGGPATSSEPVVESTAPTATEKCETCGGDSSNGNCSACYQPNASCTCTPQPAEGGDAPVAPAM